MEILCHNREHRYRSLDLFSSNDPDRQHSNHPKKTITIRGNLPASAFVSHPWNTLRRHDFIKLIALFLQCCRCDHRRARIREKGHRYRRPHL